MPQPAEVSGSDGCSGDAGSENGSGKESGENPRSDDYQFDCWGLKVPRYKPASELVSPANKAPNTVRLHNAARQGAR